MQMFCCSQHLKYSRGKPSWTSVAGSKLSQTVPPKKIKERERKTTDAHHRMDLHHGFQCRYRRKTDSEHGVTEQRDERQMRISNGGE